MGKGVPKEHLWKRDLGINAQEFLENKHHIFRKVVKEVSLYEEGELKPKLKEAIDPLKGIVDSSDDSNEKMKH